MVEIKPENEMAYSVVTPPPDLAQSRHVWKGNKFIGTEVITLAEMQARGLTEGDLPPPSLDGVKSIASLTVTEFLSEFARNLVAKYPQAEREGWPSKLAEAKAVLAGALKPDEAIMLSVESALTGKPVMAIAKVVVAKAPITLAISSVVAGLRTWADKEINAARDRATVESVSLMLEQKVAVAAELIAGGDAVALNAALKTLAR